jgi:hypothetical protein
VSFGGGGRGGGRVWERLENRHFLFYTFIVKKKNWLLFEKIADFSQKSSFSLFFFFTNF